MIRPDDDGCNWSKSIDIVTNFVIYNLVNVYSISKYTPKRVERLFYYICQFLNEIFFSVKTLHLAILLKNISHYTVLSTG